MSTNPTTATAAGSGAPAAAATANDQQTRGLPYYEKLRRELRETIQRKRLLDKNLSALEDSIYRFEQSYLEETGAGNIIKGFDNYIKGASSTTTPGAGGAAGGSRRKAHVFDADRVFSRSSVTFNRDSPMPQSATPSHAGTPQPSGREGTAPAGNKGGNKKKKGNAASTDGRGRDSETPKPPVKRLKITYGRD